MICGNKGNQKPPELPPEIMTVFKATHFSLVEVQEMHRRFKDITKGSPNMTKEQFREIMGFVDNQSSLYIVDRIFDSLSESKGVPVLN